MSLNSTNRPRPAISVIINTLNEEPHIRGCILSVQGFASEVLVCDMHSDDLTVQIAEDLGARIVFHERTGFVEPARRYAISQSECEWVLVLDSDERLTSKLAGKLLEIATDDLADAVNLWFRVWYFGGWVDHGQFFFASPRFFKKRAYLESYQALETEVHRNFTSLRNHPRLITLPRHYFIEHLAYPTIAKYVTKTLGGYSVMEAERLVREKTCPSLLKLVGSPTKSFLLNFFWRQGYRDGTRGLIICTLTAFYHFIIWANVWFLSLEGADEHAAVSEGSLPQRSARN